MMAFHDAEWVFYRPWLWRFARIISWKCNSDGAWCYAAFGFSILRLHREQPIKWQTPVGLLLDVWNRK